MSYTQRHSHESLPPCPRSEYKEKKRNLYFLYAPPSPPQVKENFFHPNFRPGSFAMCVAEFRHSSYFTSASRVSFSLLHACISANIHTLALFFSFLFLFLPSFSRLSHANPYWYFFLASIAFLFFSSRSFSQALTHTYVHNSRVSFVASYK